MAMNGDRPGTGAPADDPHDPRLASLYRVGAEEAPPAHLDAAIRAAARREVAAGPGSGGSPLLRAWRVPVALAAVLVLSVSVVTLMQHEDAGRVAELSGAPPRPAQERTERKEASPRAEAPATPTAPPRVTPAPTGEVSRHSVDVPRPIAPDARPDAPVAQRPAEGVGSRREQNSAEPTTATAPDIAGGPVADRASAGDSAPAAAKARAELAERAPTAAASAPPARPVQGPSALVRAYENAPPQKWLEKIAELRRENRQAEADELLQAFRLRYPDHPLPDGLR